MMSSPPKPKKARSSRKLKAVVEEVHGTGDDASLTQANLPKPKKARSSKKKTAASEEMHSDDAPSSYITPQGVLEAMAHRIGLEHPELTPPSSDYSDDDAEDGDYSPDGKSAPRLIMEHDYVDVEKYTNRENRLNRKYSKRHGSFHRCFVCMIMTSRDKCMKIPKIRSVFDKWLDALSEGDQILRADLEHKATCHPNLCFRHYDTNKLVEYKMGMRTPRRGEFQMRSHDRQKVERLKQISEDNKKKAKTYGDDRNNNKLNIIPSTAKTV